MQNRGRALLTLVTLVAACSPAASRPPAATPSGGGEVAVSGDGAHTVHVRAPGEPVPEDDRRMMYTTYFYTAAEAIVHGYHADTNVRIVSMETGEPVWAGHVGEGDTELVRTGAGVFSFISDKKATILVGTPSSCTVVGYWGRDEDGSFLSDRFLVRLPASTNTPDDRAIVWAWQDTNVTVTDRTSGDVLFEGRIPAHGRFELPNNEVTARGSHVLDVRAERPVVAVQVYYDEGFAVPTDDGRTSGRDFMTYLGRTTEGVNDLVLVSYQADANVRVEDMETEEVVYAGPVAAGSVHTLTLHERHLRITSDREISAFVAPYEHYTGIYAEHHFAGGAEGTGIENDFILPTPDEIWIFSYFNGNHVTVQNMNTGEEDWNGDLAAGNVHGIHAGHGLYRVRSTTGASVMGGAHQCGAEYSPAGRLFQVDEAVMRAVVEIRHQRQVDAAARGETLTPEAAAAPLSEDELQEAARRVQRSTGSSVYGPAAVEQRIDAIESNR